LGDDGRQVTASAFTSTSTLERPFAGRVALVTGGAGAIGRATAQALAARGATVFAADIGNVDGGDTFKSVRLDVTRKADITAVVASIVDAHGGIDLLVNVAGVISHGSAEDLAEAEWDRVLGINLKGTFLCCQAVMPQMKARRYGRIVNIGSIVGKNGGNARPWIDTNEQVRSANVAYGVSKAGIHAMTAFLAKELAAHGVTVNAVAPGPVATSMTSNYPQALRALVPVGRMGTLDDVIDAILFLLSERSSYITGEVLDINGGMWCD
jgi:NAD(P)-dependent dehydrogenase (short-subunit alcohol dehydrogenase family)